METTHRAPGDPLYLKRIRHERGLGGKKVGELLGVHWTSVYRHEREPGKAVPLWMLQKYADLYNVHIAAFFIEPELL